MATGSLAVFPKHVYRSGGLKRSSFLNPLYRCVQVSRVLAVEVVSFSALGDRYLFLQGLFEICIQLYCWNAITGMVVQYTLK